MKFKKAGTRLDTPLNDKEPVRIAFLGGPKCGKTALISKLTVGNFSDTYYPLRLTQPILFNFAASLEALQTVLDETNPKKILELATKHENVLLSPVLYHSLVKSALKKLAAPPSEADNMVINSTNGIYANYTSKSGEVQTTPILMELIDTPAFNPTQIVPFLEASLYVKLDRDVLHNLADEPRRPVSTNPLLVASGASEMNGTVDGYFFMYSAVPSNEPPAYEEFAQESPSEPVLDITPESSAESYNSDGTLKSVTLTTSNTTFSLLPVMKSALDEAWKEYYTYKMRWELGKERDVFSLKLALKNMMSERATETTGKRNSITLLETPVDPADPSCPPPIWIVCTNINLPLASPKLIEDGKKISKLWKCGFIAMDMESDVEGPLALMVRELVERATLRRKRK